MPDYTFDIAKIIAFSRETIENSRKLLEATKHTGSVLSSASGNSDADHSLLAHGHGNDDRST